MPIAQSARRQGARVARGLVHRGRAGGEALAEAGRVVRRDAELYGVPAAAIARRAARLRRAHGFSLGEAHRLGLLDPAAPPEAPGRYVSKRRLLAVQARLNPEELSHLTEEKTAFYRLAEGAGLPVPATHAVLCHSGGGAARSGRPLQGRDAWIDWLERESPEEFVVKPAKGYHGLGVRLVERRGRRLRLRGGEELSAAELCDRLLADRRFHVNLVQERLRNHPEMPGDPELLSSLRVITLIDGRGRAGVLACLLRIATGTADVSNIREGRTGNVSAEIDPPTGAILRLAATDARGMFAGVPPDAGRRVPSPGQRLPAWDAAVALALRAAEAFAPMRALAWDLGLTPSGPVVIETNKWWDPPCPLGGAPRMVERMLAAGSAPPAGLSEATPPAPGPGPPPAPARPSAPW